MCFFRSPSQPHPGPDGASVIRIRRVDGQGRLASAAASLVTAATSPTREACGVGKAGLLTSLFLQIDLDLLSDKSYLHLTKNNERGPHSTEQLLN